MNVLFVKTIQSHIKRNTYIDRCVKYFNLGIWITLFQTRQQSSSTYEISDWKKKQFRTQAEKQLIKDL